MNKMYIKRLTDLFKRTIWGETDKEHFALGPLGILLYTVQLVGLFPFNRHSRRCQIKVKWCGFTAIRAIVTTLWFLALTALVITGTVLYLFMGNSVEEFYDSRGLSEEHQKYLTNRQMSHGIHLMFLGFFMGCVFNSCVYSLNFLLRAQKFSQYFNSWQDLAWKHKLATPGGLRWRMLVHTVVMFSYIFILLLTQVLSVSPIALQVIDMIQEVFFHIPRELLLKDNFTRTVLRLAMSVCLLQVMLAYKSALLLLATLCSLAAKTSQSWRRQLEIVLRDVWKSGLQETEKVRTVSLPHNDGRVGVTGGVTSQDIQRNVLTTKQTGKSTPSAEVLFVRSYPSELRFPSVFLNRPSLPSMTSKETNSEQTLRGSDLSYGKLFRVPTVQKEESTETALPLPFINHDALKDITFNDNRVGEDQLQVLVEGRQALLELIEDTMKLFAANFLCYYIVTILTLCIELYLIVYKLATEGSFSTVDVLLYSFVVFQSLAFFFIVSLATADIHDESGRTRDVLRVGVPHTASPQVQHNFRLLISAVRCSGPAITGGGFFTINRPFIITVLGAVATYFILMVQLRVQQ